MDEQHTQFIMSCKTLSSSTWWVDTSILPFSFVFLLLLSVQTALCADSQFEACSKNANCGKGPNISYPFWISGQQPPYCGFPGFQLTCKNKQPTLGLATTKYVLCHFSYQNRSLRLIDPKVNTQGGCSSQVQNVTLDYPPPFRYGPNNTDLFLRVADVHGKSSFYTQLLNEGFDLIWNIASDCSICQTSGGRCGFNWTTYDFVCLCPDRPYLTLCGYPRSTRNWRKKLVIAIVSSIIFAIILLAILMRRKLSSNGIMPFWKKRTRNTQNVEAFLRNYKSLAPKRYSYSDIKKMTNSFNEKLGQGGYGGVFKGKLPDGRLVAVKILNNSKGNGEEFINEVASIRRTSHIHIVTFLGFCFDGSKKALIYEFMSNGSLEKFIYNKKTMRLCLHLGWERLHQVAVGIAQGLEYLHHGCNTQILHFDIKPHNILLDEDFCPKISDFGLAKLCPRKESITSMVDARGTVGYIAPEMFSRNFGGVPDKSDVYSYGMMVLEMVGGRKNIDAGVDHTSEIYFPHWIYKHIGQGEHLQLDMVVREEDEEIARKLVLVGLWCIQTDSKNRPSISKIVDMLDGSLELLPIPPKPILSPPPRQLADSFTGSTS